MNKPPRASHPKLSADAWSALVGACLEGDDHAWHRLVTDLSGLVMSVLIRHGIPVDERDELFQSTFLAVHEQLPRLEKRERFVSWVIGIASRQAISWVRKHARRRRILDEKVAHEPVRDVPLPDQDIEALEAAQAVALGMSRMGEDCRALLTDLFHREPPASYREIAETHGIKRGSIGKARQRCLDGLREILQGEDLL